ncbi:TerC family protein [Nitrospirillum iridis]|uniref:Putative tellurium resistance membrane protein TerC n=1 Tax=Nitrospirillum iridis TaxID=765888 RepID=A0A7X0B1F0_9PROT|nr:putative tellurium resistance membrane protein TerC [Nitrospirillum iridis]
MGFSPMDFLADPGIWLGLLTLVALEVVLGIDNLVFIAIVADKLPPEQRNRVRLVGLSLALIMRLILLFSISWIVTLTQPLLSVAGFALSGRDLILVLGGGFLLAKGTMELHERLEGATAHHSPAAGAAATAFWRAVLQIVLLDAVFSLDSVITAVGMVEELPVMVAAVCIAMVVMLVASKPLMAFISRHPTVIILGLGFLLMIGFSLVAEGLGLHIPKGYLYAAIGFSILIEAANQVGRRKKARPVAAVPGDPAITTVMTPRDAVEWLDLSAGQEDVRAAVLALRHSHVILARDGLDTVLGFAASHDLLKRVMEGQMIDGDDAFAPVVARPDQAARAVLALLRDMGAELAVVMDAQGRVLGVATPADAVKLLG